LCARGRRRKSTEDKDTEQRRHRPQRQRAERHRQKRHTRKFVCVPVPGVVFWRPVTKSEAPQTEIQRQRRQTHKHHIPTHHTTHPKETARHGEAQ